MTEGTPDRLAALVVVLTREGRGIEFWILTLAVMGWIWAQPGEGRHVARAVEAITSVGMTFAAAPALAEWSGWPLLIVAVIVTAFGQDVIRTLRGLARDPAFIGDLLNFALRRKP